MEISIRWAVLQITNNNNNAAGCSQIGPPRLVVEGGLQLFRLPKVISMKRQKLRPRKPYHGFDRKRHFILIDLSNWTCNGI